MFLDPFRDKEDAKRMDLLEPFGEKRIRPTHYSLTSAILRLWVIEGSVDGDKWTAKRCRIHKRSRTLKRLPCWPFRDRSNVVSSDCRKPRTPVAPRHLQGESDSDLFSLNEAQINRTDKSIYDGQRCRKVFTPQWIDTIGPRLDQRVSIPRQRSESQHADGLEERLRQWSQGQKESKLLQVRNRYQMRLLR
jgi:hypothetical protein